VALHLQRPVLPAVACEHKYYNNRALCRVLAGDAQGALDDVRESLLLCSNNARTYYIMARALLLQDAVDDARAALDRALREDCNASSELTPLIKKYLIECQRAKWRLSDTASVRQPQPRRHGQRDSAPLPAAVIAAAQTAAQQAENDERPESVMPNDGDDESGPVAANGAALRSLEPSAAAESEAETAASFASPSPSLSPLLPVSLSGLPSATKSSGARSISFIFSSPYAAAPFSPSFVPQAGAAGRSKRLSAVPGTLFGLGGSPTYSVVSDTLLSPSGSGGGGGGGYGSALRSAASTMFK
jgi:hypothetical protein